MEALSGRFRTDMMLYSLDAQTCASGMVHTFLLTDCLAMRASSMNASCGSQTEVVLPALSSGRRAWRDATANWTQHQVYGSFAIGGAANV